jgi:cell division ATPase FtsA
MAFITKPEVEKKNVQRVILKAGKMVQPNSWKIWDVLMMSWIIDDDAFICVYIIYI